jgi:uncharacterized membrane protein
MNKALTFLNPLSPGLCIAVFIAVLIYLLYTYSAFSIKVSFFLRSLLFSLRLAVFLIIFLIILDPYINQPGENEWMGVLYDTSKSLSAPVKWGDIESPSRQKKIITNLKEDNYWQSLKLNILRKEMQFNEILSDLNAVEEMSAFGESKLKSAMKQIDMSYKNEEGLLGWILFSDGAATDWPLDEQIAPEQFHFPWITVAVGDEGEVKNLQIKAPEFKPEVFVGEILNFKIHWESNFAPGHSTTLVVKLDHQEILNQEILLDDLSYALEIPVKKPGHHSIDISFQKLDQEAAAEDNAARVWFEAFPRKIKVYYVESFYKDENLFKQGLEEDDVFEVDFASSLIGFSRERGVPFVGDARLGFPGTREKLLAYDVIVLSDVNRKLLTDTQISWIRELVEEKGGALVMIGGVDSFGDGGYVGTEVEKMLPVEISEEYKKDAFLTARGTVEKSFRPILSAGAIEHPMMQIGDSVKASEVLWKEMPLLGGYNYVGRLKPAAVSLLEHPLDKSKNGARVILAVQEYGRGKTLAFTSDVTDNWGQWIKDWKSKEGEWITAKFWRRSFKWLTEKRILESISPVKVTLDKIIPEEKEALKLKIEFPSEYQHTDQDWIQVKINQGNKIIFDQSFQNNLAKTSYDIDLPALSKGDYVLSFKFLARDASPFEKTLYFSVSSQWTEMRHLNAQHALLQKIADASGGEFLLLTKIDQLETAVEKIRRSNLRQTAKPYWHQLKFLLLILGLLALDWFIRKRKNLE